MNNTQSTTATLAQLEAKFHDCFLFTNRAGHSDESLSTLAAETAKTALATMQAHQ